MKIAPFTAFLQQRLLPFACSSRHKGQIKISLQQNDCRLVEYRLGKDARLLLSGVDGRRNPFAISNIYPVVFVCSH